MTFGELNMTKKAKSKWQSLNPDMVMVNGKIITVDSGFSIAEAVAVKGDKIIGVGSNAEIKKTRGRKYQSNGSKRGNRNPGYQRCPLPS